MRNIDPNHPLIEGARYTDAQGTEHGMEAFVEKAGLDIDTLMHVAEQRALRVALLHSRGEKEMMKIASSSAATAAPMNRDERAMIAAFIPAYLDGLLIGWEGRRLSETQ